MKVKETQLTNLQANFVKELMGDPYMTDTRAEATLLKLCSKFDIEPSAVAKLVDNASNIERTV